MKTPLRLRCLAAYRAAWGAPGRKNFPRSAKQRVGSLLYTELPLAVLIKSTEETLKLLREIEAEEVSR